MSLFSLQFVTRNGCQICHEKQPIVESEAARLGLRMTLVDVDSEPELVMAFGERVPVVLDREGSVLAEGDFDRQGLRRQLKRLV